MKKSSDFIEKLFEKAKNKNELSEWEFIQTIMRELYSNNYYSIEQTISHNSIYDTINEHESINKFQRQIIQENISFVNSLVNLGNTLRNDFSNFIRIRLLTYCYITEMRYLHNIVANLLWISLGKTFYDDPFSEEVIKSNLKVIELDKMKTMNIEVTKRLTTNADQRIKLIVFLCNKAKMKELGEFIESFYDNHIRNSFYHSKYIFDKEGYIGFDERHNYKYTTEEYGEKIDKAIMFYIMITNSIEKYRKSYTVNKTIKARNPHYKKTKHEIGKKKIICADIITNSSEGIIYTQLDFNNDNSNKPYIGKSDIDIVDVIGMKLSK